MNANGLVMFLLEGVLGYLAQHFAFVIGMHGIARKRIVWPRVIIVSVLCASILSLLRQIEMIQFGVHTLLNVLITNVGCVLICLLKGAAAGFLAGVCYDAIAKKNDKAAVVVSGIVCPVVNTGLFILGMLVFFFDTLSGWASGQNMLVYIIVVLTGVNFLVELGVNMLLAAGITRIIRAGKKNAN